MERPQRRRGDIPDWLKFITSLPACPYCGVVVGGCMIETLGIDSSICPKKEKENEQQPSST